MTIKETPYLDKLLGAVPEIKSNRAGWRSTAQKSGRHFNQNQRKAVRANKRAMYIKLGLYKNGKNS